MLAQHILREQFDVVLVQEVFLLRLGPFILSGNFERFARALAKGGLIYHSNPLHTLPQYLGQNSGCAIFSTTFPHLAPPALA